MLCFLGSTALSWQLNTVACTRHAQISVLYMPITYKQCAILLGFMHIWCKDISHPYKVVKCCLVLLKHMFPNDMSIGWCWHILHKIKMLISKSYRVTTPGTQSEREEPLQKHLNQSMKDEIPWCQLWSLTNVQKKKDFDFCHCIMYWLSCL